MVEPSAEHPADPAEPASADAMHWLARGEVELPVHLEWLSDREHAQLATIRFRKRRTEYLTRRWTAKHAVAAVLDLGDGDAALASVEIRNRASGAPWVQVAGDSVELEVSLTDRAGWAVCLLESRAGAGAPGIDLELVEPRSSGFVEDFLTEAERTCVRSLPAVDAQHLMANLFWSAKEAALKVLQVGLRVDTRSVEVVAGTEPGDDGWAELRITHVDGTVFPGWWRRDGRFVLTVASRTAIEPPTQLGASADLRAAAPVHSWLERPLA